MTRNTGVGAPSGGTAVIYARFSSSKQREASIEDQLRVCREWCVREGYEVVAEYCDRAASGRTDDRPEFKRMVYNAGESDIVLVYMMDRFSRDVYDAPIYKKRLADKGVRVVSATESMPDGPEAILIGSIYEAMAAMESAHTSQRTRRGMEGNALKCMHNGVGLFGYDLGDDGYYHVNEAQAQIVRDAYAMRASGESLATIARTLAARGVKSYRGTPCSYGMVQGMIGNEKYLGTYRWGGVRVEGGMPAILTEEEFMAATSVKSSKRRHDEDWTDFALAGRGVCGECGMNLVGVSGRGRHNVKYTYYRCSARCGCRPVRAPWLEREVARRIRAMLADEGSVSEICDAVERYLSESDGTAALENARKRLSDTDRGLANLLKAVESGMPYEAVRERYEELTRISKQLKREISGLEESVEFDRDDFARYLSAIGGLDDRGVLDAFVWQVQLTSESVVAVLNYDIEGEPARIGFPTGSNELVWLPGDETIRTITRGQRLARDAYLYRGRLVVVFERAA